MKRASCLWLTLLLLSILQAAMAAHVEGKPRPVSGPHPALAQLTANISAVRPSATQAKPRVSRLASTSAAPKVIEEAERDAAPGTDAGAISTRVLWTISGYVMGKDASWGEREAKAMLFKPLDITGDAIIFDGCACRPVHFQRETVAAAEFLLAEWQVTPQAVDVRDERVLLVRTDCPFPGFSRYLRLSDNRLLVRINGVFFFFQPAVRR